MSEQEKTVSTKDLTVAQKKALVVLLDSKNKTAYDCHTTMKTMHALLTRKLIQRTNWEDVVWLGKEPE